MLINELFTKSLKWEYTQNWREDVTAKFDVGEFEYSVKMLGNGSGDFMLSDPEEHFGNTWEVDFKQHSDSEGTKSTITGSGNALVVLTTVMEIISQIIKEKNIITLIFQADNAEPSRLKLYHRLAKQFEKKGWRYIDDKELNLRSDFGGNDSYDSYDELRARGKGFSKTRIRFSL